MRTVYLDAGPIAHLSGEGPLQGQNMLDSSKLVMPPGMGIVVERDTIVSISSSEELKSEYGSTSDHTNHELKIIQLNGKAIIPGFVDTHTHAPHASRLFGSL